MTESTASSQSPASAASKPAASKSKTHAFQTEVQQLLQLMIHSLYSNKEVFVRELISNAADACDKLRFAALTDKSLVETDANFGIWLEVDEKKHTIRLRDNGIGMTQDEVIQDIGTIARSGTKAFIEKMQQPDSNPAKTKSNEPSNEQFNDQFIGQFGVGFYSCFLVSQNVTLLTRKAGHPARDGVQWHSDGSGEYTIARVPREQRGTEIIIQLNRADKEFADPFRLRSIVAKYSDHISIPIYMQKSATESEAKDGIGDEIGDKTNDQSKGQSKVAPPPEWEAVNRGSALWARAKSKISEAEYHTFYTSLTYDPEAPMLTLHNRVEGKLEYISLLYIPARAPFDLWDRERRHGIKLYVRRIFIADDAKALMPNYLRFVRGLVDSADLPLNVSREFLQQNREIDKIRAASVKKVLAEFSKLAKRDAEQYHRLWEQYGRVLKEGMLEDFDNKETLAKLARFASTHNDESAQTTALDDYLARMPNKQEKIFYLTAENHNTAKSSPHLEVFRKHGIEVLLLSDSVDEWFINHLTEYQGKPLQSIAKGELDIESLKTAAATEQKPETEPSHKAIQPLVDKFKAVLGEQVKDVRVSDRLVGSPSCLIADAHDMGANMERILHAIGQDAPTARPILEINPEHPIIKQIDPDSDLSEEWARLLFDQAALAEGATLQNPGDFVKRMNRLLVQ